MWGSADRARLNSNALLCCFGYYYAAFHSGHALRCTDGRLCMESLQRVRHQVIETWLAANVSTGAVRRFECLRTLRETTSYLGFESAVGKIRAVRGHPVKFFTGDEALSLSEAVERAREDSEAFVTECLQRVGRAFRVRGWGWPRPGDDESIANLLHEDYMLNVIPRTDEGATILGSAYQLLQRVLSGEAAPPGTT